MERISMSNGRGPAQPPKPKKGPSQPKPTSTAYLNAGLGANAAPVTVHPKLSINMTARDFLKKIQDVTNQKFWVSPPKEPTFEDVLKQYAVYYHGLKSNKEKVELSTFFWNQIKEIGTPIIEQRKDGKCDVYFLFHEDNLSMSKQVLGTKKDLYLQGDFHGYGATDGRQRLSELSDTGIMWRKDSMPRDAIVVYQYIQVERSHRGTKPLPERSPFFTHGEGFTPHSTVTSFPEIPQSGCKDEYSTHTSPYPGFDSGARIFRVSADSKHAHIQAKPIDWPNLLSTEMQSNTKKIDYHATLYSDQAGDLHRSETPVTKQYHDDLYYSNQDNSPYAKFTRNIHVFKPASGKIDDIVVINDGTPYLMTGMLDHFEKMIADKRLSPNTAFVFINVLPGLEKTLSRDVAVAYNQDPSAKLPGMGVRLIDYKHGIDQYIDFIADKLFPQLKNEINIPEDPSHRVMIGSSLSGTASIYIDLKRPDIFGAVMALSPSPDNRAILSKIPKEMLADSNIHLSCGQLEHPDYAAANANVEYAAELSRKLGTPLRTGAYGHQNMAWNDVVDRTLPEALNTAHSVKLTKNPPQASQGPENTSDSRSLTRK